ncbi:methyl-accepting chemotaxis protein [Oceanicola sp. S124]|uniref:methyl-accepting chemotaxis protein n=1 Tax=Oceanicola sp. S124 TaxID=1042378 RepID=UPI000255A44B|nr:methyl-accepting chemotaxis protein [Oceanicola sp. S124]
MTVSTGHRDAPVINEATLGPRFTKARAMAQRLVAFSCLACVPAVAAAGLLVGNGTFLPTTLASILLAMIASATLRMTGKTARIVVSLALTGQCILFNAAMMGHPMQPDSHMLYFVALTAIATLSSRPALLWSGGVVAAHHLVLTFTAPALAFLTADLGFNLWRVIFHAATVVLAGCNLMIIVHFRLLQTYFSERRAEKLEATMSEAQQALREARRQKEEAQEATRRAEEAHDAASRAQKAAETALAEARANAGAARAAEASNAANQEQHAREVEEVIAHLQQKLSCLAQGDLTTRIDRPLPAAFADLSQSFNIGVARLEEAFAAVQAEVVSIRVQSREINDAAEDLGRRTEKQVTTLSEAACTLQQLTTLIGEIASDTGAARTATEETRGEAVSGSEVMTRTVSAMDQIEGSSAEIRKIITVIDDIAFQTNLLALNAGVEAARAGTAGRGFAVVANEVRALAQRSSEAAKEIDSLINSSAGHVGRGVSLVKSTGTALGSIREAVERTAERMQAVADATADQSRGLHEVNAAIKELESFTQRNAAIFEETLTANAMLSETAEGLATRIGQFRIGENRASYAEEAWLTEGKDRRIEQRRRA